MAKTKPEIEEFDKLSITDLMRVNNKELTIATFMKIKQVNGKVKFHDKFIWTCIGILITGFVGGLISLIILNLLGLI